MNVKRKLRTCGFYSNGIVHYSYLPDAEVDVKEHLENHCALVELVGKEKKYPILMDADDFINFTSEARALVRKLEPETPIAARAMVTQSLGQRLLSRFYISIHKPCVPMKIFSNHEEGLKWLRQYVV